MRRMVFSALAASLVLTSIGLGVAQQPPSKEPPKDEPVIAVLEKPDKNKAPLEVKLETDGIPKTLDEMLAVAMKENPDIGVAEAKAREAEEELRRARITVSQKIAAAYHAIVAQRLAVDEYTQRFETAQRLRKQGVKLISEEEYRGAHASMLHAKAALTAAEAELPYLLGRPPKMPHRVELRFDTQYLNTVRQELLNTEGLSRYAELALSGVRPAVTGDTAERLRAALDKQVNMTFKTTPMAKVAQELQTWTGVAVQLAPGADQFSVTVEFPPMPLGAAFQLLEDAEPNIHYVVRDYGILAVVQNNIPPGAVTVHEFWKMKKEKEKATAPEKQNKNPPPKDVRGKIREVDPKSGLMQITIGSDSGLEKGQTLEVLRLEPEPRYLGTIRIVEAGPKQAVGRIIRPPFSGDTIREGDDVASTVFTK